VPHYLRNPLATRPFRSLHLLTTTGSCSPVSLHTLSATGRSKRQAQGGRRGIHASSGRERTWNTATSVCRTWEGKGIREEATVGKQPLILKAIVLTLPSRPILRNWRHWMYSIKPRRKARCYWLRKPERKKCSNCSNLSWIRRRNSRWSSNRCVSTLTASPQPELHLVAGGLIYASRSNWINWMPSIRKQWTKRWSVLRKRKDKKLGNYNNFSWIRRKGSKRLSRRSYNRYIVPLPPRHFFSCMHTVASVLICISATGGTECYLQSCDDRISAPYGGRKKERDTSTGTISLGERRVR